jgi:hypothetical protein
MEGPEFVGLTGPLPVCILSVFPDTRSGNGSAHGLEGAAAYPRQTRFQVLLCMFAAEDVTEKAVEYNLKALELDPQNVDAWHNMARRISYLIDQKRPFAALKRLCPWRTGKIPAASWSRRMKA